MTPARTRRGNQCDGCARGLPIRLDGFMGHWYYHYEMKDGQEIVVMGCDADCYEPDMKEPDGT